MFEEPSDIPINCEQKLQLARLDLQQAQREHQKCVEQMIGEIIKESYPDATSVSFEAIDTERSCWSLFLHSINGPDGALLHYSEAEEEQYMHLEQLLSELEREYRDTLIGSNFSEREPITFLI